ncbi:28S ribosomal protein S11, mitochondrial [Eurytemora carolleeae]|uniref:28S ribosomal protein S11, mitochondrial n=1 Tax=Eurytemora carolleeae TaxID=1294199 RepID=UPI000C76ABF8|nr:28S ribosomal protein S11, mitochondrial [Eurytemora carolleeae]|eukprot:XP_023328791.1 28S ribosomal protein S11, mitochondrial-like [Eurytemora affinis]
MNMAKSLWFCRKSIPSLLHKSLPCVPRILGDPFLYPSRYIHTSLIRQEKDDSIVPVKVAVGKKGILSTRTHQKNDELLSSGAVELDSLLIEEQLMSEGEFKRFPDEETPDLLFNGIKFKDLPYVLMRLHKHNTRLVARHADQRYIFMNSPAMHGFTNAKKRTSVAGQVAGMMMGQKLRSYGIKHIRVRINGFNAARESTIKGITQAGIQVVCLEDQTKVEWGWPQRGKARPSK